MFLVNFIGSETVQWMIHIIVAISIVALFLGRYAGAYKFVITPVAVAVLLFGMFYEGYYFSNKANAKKIAEMKKKVEYAQQQSTQVNEVIKTKVVEKIKYVKDTANANQQVVEKVITKYDNLCTLSNAAISVHDSASRNEVARSPLDIDGGTTSLKISDVLTTVVDNYATYYQVREQVLGWQQWYREQKKIFEGVK